MDKNFNSLVQTTKGIESSFTKLRFVTISCLVGAFLCCVGSVVYSLSVVTGMGDKIYVLDDGNAMSATRQDVSVTRADEVRAQSEKFHKLFFGIVPNSDIVSKNLQAALELADRSAYNYYNNLSERDFYKQMIGAGANQWFELDSVRTDMRRQPYLVMTYGKLWVLRESNLTKSSFVSQCNMVNVARTPQNLNGLQIERFEVIKNEVIETRRR